MNFRHLLPLVFLLVLTGCRKGADSRVNAIDQALEQGMKFLEENQNSRGSWISQKYPVFRDGYSLTPLVACSLARQPGHEKAVEKAIAFMATITKEKQGAMIFPVYSLSEELVLLKDRNDKNSQTRRSQILSYLKERQMLESLGWKPEDATYGGWSESREVYARPEPPKRLDGSRQADLSSTLFVLEGLAATGMASTDPVIQNARGFVERCQNFETGDTDDGGFFLCPSSENRNKAEKFHSYGSTTADGIRALMRCGRTATDPRVKAARHWLVYHFDGDKNAGEFPERRHPVRDSLYFYYAASSAQALVESSSPGEEVSWARALADNLLRKQKKDGSWANTANLLSEDDPVLATSLACRALFYTRIALSDPQRGN